MADLNLINQQIYTDQIQPKIQQLKTQMDLRIPIWQKISPEKRKAWILSGKDPLMTLAWNIYNYLKNNFFGDVKDG